MSAALKQPVAAVVTREESATPLLDDILARVTVIEAKQSRPSPVQLRTWEEIERFAEKAARSGMVPKDFIGKPDAICIAVQMGSELGLAPMQALQNIAVVNGRPSLWGDALPGLCRASGVCKTMREWSEGEGDDLTFFCEAIRRDDPSPVISRFSVADAKRAGLWKEKPTVTKRSRDGGTYEADSGPWYSYPKRMLQMRARGFALRDAFPDVLKGLITVEEARDIPFEETGLTPRMPEQERPQPTMGHQIGDALPPQAQSDYTLTTKHGTRVFETPNQWVAAWTRLISNCKAADALDKLEAARTLNKASLERVAQIDPASADAVAQAIVQALYPQEAEMASAAEPVIDNAPENEAA